MLVGFSSIITLFNLIQVGIKNVSESSTQDYHLMNQTSLSVKAKLDQIIQMLKAFFSDIALYQNSDIELEEFKTNYSTKLASIDELISDMYRSDLQPITNRLMSELAIRIDELSGSNTQRENRLTWLLTQLTTLSNDEDKKNNQDCNSYISQGKVILESLEMISRKFEEIPTKDVEQVE